MKVVAVTGASGFIGSFIVDELLRCGYRVRAAVRDPANESKVAHLKALAQGSKGILELVQGDLLQVGSYDQAFAGADAVIHTAAVVEVVGLKDAEKEILAPAVEGTKNVLSSIDKTPSVKTLVYTSTCLAVQSFSKPVDHVFTELDWNDWSTLANGDPYGCAKTQAERLVLAHSEGKHYSVRILNPGVVLGPVLCKAHTKASTVLVREMLYHNPMLNYLCTFVDVRDVARAHVEALEKPQAAGQRFLLVGDEGCMVTTDLGPIAARACPDFIMEAKPMYSQLFLTFCSVLAYVPGLGSMVMSDFQRLVTSTPIHFSNAKAKEVLGITFRSLEETVRDSAQSMVDGGYLQPKRR